MAIVPIESSDDEGVPCTYTVSVKSPHGAHPGGADAPANFNWFTVARNVTFLIFFPAALIAIPFNPHLAFGFFVVSIVAVF